MNLRMSRCLKMNGLNVITGFFVRHLKITKMIKQKPLGVRGNYWIGLPLMNKKSATE